MNTYFKLTLGSLFSALMLGCATHTATPYDYTAFKQNQPKSILVLPPLNNSPDVRATYSFLSTVSYPLSESGYYVFPVALVDQTFKENGLTDPADMHQAPIGKLREIFGADSALYLTVDNYGASISAGAVVVSAKAKLVDLKSGTTLWTGQASASSAEGQNNNNSGGLLGVLVNAVIKQIVNNVGDKGHDMSVITSSRLLHARLNGGLLFGPRSPEFGKDNAPQ